MREVLVVDGVQLTREGLAELLRQRGVDPRVCSDDPVALAGALVSDSSDLVVVLNAATANLRSRVDAVRALGDCAIVAVGVPHTQSSILRCAAMRLAGFTMEDESIDALVALIGTADRARPRLPEAAVPVVHEAIADGHGGHRPALTAREEDLIDLLGAGLSNKDIARSLGLATPTVKNQLHHLYEKHGVHSRSELMARLRAAAL